VGGVGGGGGGGGGWGGGGGGGGGEGVPGPSQTRGELYLLIVEFQEKIWAKHSTSFPLPSREWPVEVHFVKIFRVEEKGSPGRMLFKGHGGKTGGCIGGGGKKEMLADGGLVEEWARGQDRIQEEA